MRDLSRVYCGLCQTSPDRFNNTRPMIRVWRNECTRVFCDRLINKRDVKHANEFIQEIIEDRFEQHADYALRNPLLFGGYRTAMDNGRRCSQSL
ncbi:unnamed protein product [Allacma fusca]|uniref:Dynein 2 heavy chain 1 cytoplasmic ATPase lid domain-containing protein n=1 Tax=Allacma fusca TaxID=39272 RepID=A0A8J2PPQ6_9HEXA|nr:unnamed protein product [Allacma fusca]